MIFRQPGYHKILAECLSSFFEFVSPLSRNFYRVNPRRTLQSPLKLLKFRNVSQEFGNLTGGFNMSQPIPKHVHAIHGYSLAATPQPELKFNMPISKQMQFDMYK